MFLYRKQVSWGSAAGMCIAHILCPVVIHRTVGNTIFIPDQQIRFEDVTVRYSASKRKHRKVVEAHNDQGLNAQLARGIQFTLDVHSITERPRREVGNLFKHLLKRK